MYLFDGTYKVLINTSIKKKNKKCEIKLKF